MLGRVGKVGRLGSIGGLEGIPAPDLQLNFDQASIGANAAPDDAIDFSRASNATFTDSDGLVKYAPHNLATYSEQLDNAAWTKSNSTVTANDTTAPDGTTTADKLVENSSTTQHVVYASPTITANSTNTFSVYIKADERDSVWVQLANSGFSSGFRITVADISTTPVLATATFGTGSIDDFGYEDVGNGWFRFHITGVVDSSSTTARAGVYLRNASDQDNYTGDGSSGLHLWGAQLSQHKFVPIGNPYIKTTTAAVYGARLDHEAGYFLSADQAQNLITFSEQIDNSSVYIYSRTAVTANATTAPDGTTTAEKITELATTGAHYFYRGSAHRPEGTSGKQYTISVYAKAAERSFVNVTSFTDPYAPAIFNLNTGTVHNATDSDIDNATIEDVGDGWFRLSLTFTKTADSAINLGIGLSNDNADLSYAGDVTKGAFFWGVQVEVGSTATTYNQTNGLEYYGGGATQNGLLIEEQRVNLVTDSEDFTASGWSTGSASITANQILSPNGASEADKFQANSGAIGILTDVITKSASSISLSGSIFAKSSDITSFSFTVDDGTSTNRGRMVYNLTNGTTTSTNNDGSFTNTSGDIEDYGNGWYRLTITTTTNTTTAARLRMFYTSSDGTDPVYVWGAQLEEGAFPTSYIPTSGSTVTRSADLATMGPVTGTNLILQSEDLSTTWTTTRATITANDTTAPDGLTTADKISDDGGSTGIGYVNQSFTFLNAHYVFSFYVKPDEFTSVIAYLVDTGGIVAQSNVTFDLSNGTVSSGRGYIQEAGDGWYRVAVEGVTAAGSGSARIILPSDTATTNGLSHMGRTARASTYAYHRCRGF